MGSAQGKNSNPHHKVRARSFLKSAGTGFKSTLRGASGSSDSVAWKGSVSIVLLLECTWKWGRFVPVIKVGHSPGAAVGIPCFYSVLTDSGASGGSEWEWVWVVKCNIFISFGDKG